MNKAISALVLLTALAAMLGCGAQPANPLSRPVVLENRARQEPSGGPLSFVQITDTHLDDEESFERARMVVESIDDLPMDIAFVVVTGDITSDLVDDEKTVSRALALFGRLRVPVHYISGNHDILRSNLDQTLRAFRKRFGDLCSSAVYEGVKFVFIYTEPLAKDFEVPGYDPFGQLEAQLAAGNGMPTVVFHHTPSVEDFFADEMHEGWPEAARERWEQLLNTYNVKGVIAGHFHRDEHHWLGNVPVYISAPVDGFWGRQATFRIYEYRSGKIGYRTQYIR